MMTNNGAFGVDACASRRCRYQGFSLVELLVSIAVAFVLMTALLQSMVSSLDSWTKQEKVFSSQREGRAAMRILADDLASLVAIPSGGPLDQDPQAVAGMQPVRLIVDAGDEDSVSTSRLAFLRTVKKGIKGEDNGRGDLQLVLYGLALTADSGASGLEPDAASKKLVRREFSPAETFRRLENHRVGGQALVFEADWKELEEQPQNQPGQTLAQLAVRNAVLAHDVIRFDCRALINTLPGTDQPLEWPTHQLPSWVEVVLRVTNRQTGRLLKSPEDWRGEGVRADAITNGTPDVFEDDKEVRTFSMRIRLPSVTL